MIGFATRVYWMCPKGHVFRDPWGDVVRYCPRRVNEDRHFTDDSCFCNLPMLRMSDAEVAMYLLAGEGAIR